MKVFQTMNLVVTTYALQKYMDALQEMNSLNIYSEKKALILFGGLKCRWCCRSMWSLIERAGVAHLERWRSRWWKGAGPKNRGWGVKNTWKKNKKTKKDVLVSQVYSICGYQRQCPRNISYEKQNKQTKKSLHDLGSLDLKWHSIIVFKT